MAISVGIVDNQPVLVAGMRWILERDQRFRVIGTGHSARDVFDLAANSLPDVIVVDPYVPGNVLQETERSVSEYPKSRILAFSNMQSVEFAVSLLEAGAAGYALKNIPVDEVVEAILKVNAGETYITPSFATKVVFGLRDSVRRKSEPTVEFSRREKEVLRLLLNGQTNREIADASNLSEKTVKHYMSVLMQKLNARNRVEVVLAAQSMKELGMQRVKLACLAGLVGVECLAGEIVLDLVALSAVLGNGFAS